MKVAGRKSAPPAAFMLDAMEAECSSSLAGATADQFYNVWSHREK